MILGRRLALLGSSALLGTLFLRTNPFHALAAGHNRVHTSVRNEFEFAPLVALPTPLLANFCILTSERSQQISSVLKQYVETSKRPIRCVDVEVDEEGTRPLVTRYPITDMPTVLLFENSQLNGSLVPRGTSDSEVLAEISEFVDSQT